jgi:hypothetical protein
MWVRPGMGAWQASYRQLLLRPRDGVLFYFDSIWVLKTSDLSPIGSSPAAPPAFAPGDLFVGVEHSEQRATVS